jgi:hypothetical protein
MNRMYFLVPNIAITEDIVDDLILMNIEEENIGSFRFPVVDHKI